MRVGAPTVARGRVTSGTKGTKVTNTKDLDPLRGRAGAKDRKKLRLRQRGRGRR